MALADPLSRAQSPVGPRTFTGFASPVGDGSVFHVSCVFSVGKKLPRK